MFGWHYTVHIIEKRPDNTLVWCYNKQVNTMKEAKKSILDALSKMKNPPYDITIYKDWNDQTIPTTPFQWGAGKMTFHETDFYL